MNVLFAINEVFVHGFVSTVFSFCFNNQGKHRFFVMHDGLSEKAVWLIRKKLDRFQCEINLIDIGTGAFGDDLFRSLPRYYSQSINRLLPQLAVPDDVHRLLYLDSDLTINGSLQDFYDLDLQGNFLAAPSVRRDGQDGGPYWDQEAGVYNLLKIPLRPDTTYFNSGVLLLDVDKFRTVDGSFYADIVRRNKENIVFADQDILNLAYEGKTLNIIDRRLNCTIPNNMRLRKGELRWVKKEVKALHYVVATKPWMYWKYTNPLFMVYMKYYRHEAGFMPWLGRYIIWFTLKPFHFLAHCWRKSMSILKGLFRREQACA